MNEFVLTLEGHPDMTLASHAKGYKGASMLKIKKTRELRGLAKILCLQAKKRDFQTFKNATIEYEFYFPDRIQRDAANAVQAMKAAVDGCCDAGIIAGDHWEVLQIGGVHCEVDRENPRAVLIFRRE